ncbi:MAG: inositol-3-phosphate synthase [Planctomycetales bacterium]
MSQDRIGVWFIGALGGVATTATVGLAALQEGLSQETALVSALPAFKDLGLADWKQFVVGGHEIRTTTYQAEADVLYRNSRVFSPELLNGVAARLKEWDANIKPGTLLNVGPTIASFADEKTKKFEKEKPWDAVTRLKTDIEQFQTAHKLSKVLVVNVSSTEPPLDKAAPSTWKELEAALKSSTESIVPASTLYAIAAMLSGCPFINFTPSIGSDIPALNDLALQQKVLHVGRDGKTGETLMKSILAPMFAARNLHVMSWVGHNIFGNMDGKVLDDPINKANKVRSKDHLLTEILGYKPQTLVSIEYIESMGDWKTAWDHIHFEGFLGTKMALQFTWQGCDSLLAAPLVLDLIRLSEREQRRGKSGIMSVLSSFFKSPMGCDQPEFHQQYDLLPSLGRRT